MSILPNYLRDRLLAPDGKVSNGGGRRVQGLDLENPLDKLYAFGKRWATYWDDGYPIGTWEAYARSVPPDAAL